MKTYLNIILFSLFVFAGCSSSQQSASKCDSIFLKYEISFGSGGGFTGERNGYTLDTLGNVEVWHKYSALSTDKHKMGKLTCEQIKYLNNYIDSSKIDSVFYNKKGNVTNFITLKNKTSNVEISWPETLKHDNVPAGIIDFYNLLVRNISQINKK